MPMKRSGRSVAAASRVMEIEEVLEPIIVSGLSDAQSWTKVLRLTSSFSVGLDHDVAIGEVIETQPRRDFLQRTLPLFLGDALTAHLARQVAVDRGETGLDLV